MHILQQHVPSVENCVLFNEAYFFLLGYDDDDNKDYYIF